MARYCYQASMQGRVCLRTDHPTRRYPASGTNRTPFDAQCRHDRRFLAVLRSLPDARNPHTATQFCQVDLGGSNEVHSTEYLMTGSARIVKEA